MNGELWRGLIIGLWILTGLAFLTSALFPGSTGAPTLGPFLLGITTIVTALSGRPVSLKPGLQRTTTTRVLRAMSLALTLAIALTIIHEGDRRSFFFVVLATVVAFSLGMRREK